MRTKITLKGRKVWLALLGSVSYNVSMIVIPCKNAAFFDVDDTLVMWNATPEELEKNGVHFVCPGSFTMIDGEMKESAPWKALLLPHRYHIEQLKKYKMATTKSEDGQKSP
jgi:hypothetical protein